MQELKFRVWSDFWKRYAFDAELYADGSLYAMFDDDNGVPHHENTDLVVEFNTGLKDKNGKEIYEGDIVRCSFGESGAVEFRHGAYYIVGDDINDMSNWKGTAFEVIGNIHENPELLEGEE